jgi:hypothetical protein
MRGEFVQPEEAKRGRGNPGQARRVRDNLNKQEELGKNWATKQSKGHPEQARKVFDNPGRRVKDNLSRQEELATTWERNKS